MNTELMIAIFGVGGTLLGVMLGEIVPIILSINNKLHTLEKDVGRIEGAMTGAYSKKKGWRQLQ